MKPPLRALLLSSVLLFGPPPPSYADDDETQFLLEANRRRIQRDPHSDWLKSVPFGDSHSITINGKEYRVGGRVEEMAFGIYYALNFQQWEKVEEFLSRYRILAGHQPALILLAEGLLARAKGDIGMALSKLQAANKAAPNDTRILLELARLYAEDHQNREALQQFRQAAERHLPEATRQAIQRHIDGIEKRTRWHGSISIGPGYNSNFNQANGFEKCIMTVLDTCIVTESLPKPIGSSFLGYQATLLKQTPVSRHHNLTLRSIAYGRHYSKNDPENTYLKNYSDHTTRVYAGYNYRNASTEYTLSPYFEHYYRNGHTNYTAPGIDVGLKHHLNKTWSLHLQTNSKRHRYSKIERTRFADYTLSSLEAGTSYNLSPLSSVYAGVEWARRRYAWAPASSKEHSVRISTYTFFESGFYINAMATYRDNRFDAKTFLSRHPRHDIQKTLIASFGAPRWNFEGIYPELRFKRSINKSNLIYYAYKQNEVSLHLKYNF